MNLLKALVKKYFSSFAYFYSYLGIKTLWAFVLSVVVGFLDGLGLAMFVPLLEVVSGNTQMEYEDMGQMQLLLQSIENIGFSLSLGNVLLFMLIFFSLKGLAYYLSQVYIIVLQQRFTRKVRLQQLSSLNHVRFEHFMQAPAGYIQNTMSGEVDRVSQGFKYYFQSFQYGVMVLVYLGFAFAVDFEFALLVGIGGLLTHFLYTLIYKKTKGASRQLTRYNSRFQGQIIQHVGNFKYLKGTGSSFKYGEKLRETIFKIEKSRRKIGMLSAVSHAVREPLLVGVIVLVIFIQVQFFAGALGTIVVSLLLFYRALLALTNMQSYWNRFLEVSGSLETTKAFREELKAQRESNGTIPFTALKTEIRLKNVQFSYGEQKVLHQINLAIKKNQSIAFVGESGSGKTTLIHLIIGLLIPEKGEVLIDGHNLEELEKHSYQERIGYVSQDPVIFDDTLFNNVSFWAEPTAANLSRFEKSLKQASLSAYVQGLPEGKDTRLGQAGINLSGGQKQRVAIARELYKNTELLVLDEATSALDSETENAIQESIEKLQGKYTLLMVAHRLSTVKKADQIVFMENGRITAIDHFENLLNNNARFRKMVALQELKS